MRLLLLLAACTPEPPDGKHTADPTTTTGCPTGQVLDVELCVPQACGIGTWGNLPVDEDTIYVVEGGDGDGTESRPLGSIQAALDLAGGRNAGLVAVAAGTYRETLSMGTDHDGVTLAGRCRELVTIDGSEGEALPAIDIIGATSRGRLELRIEGVTVTGGTYTGLWVEKAVVTAQGVDVLASALIGIAAVDADVALTSVSVSDTQPDRSGDWGRGINVQDRATLTAADCTVHGNTEIGVYASNAGTTVELVDTVVRDTAPSPDGSAGWGIGAADGATLTATGCTVQRNTEIGVFAHGEGTTVELADTWVQDTAPRPDRLAGRGIIVMGGAALTAVDSTVQGNTELGVFAADDGTTVELWDTVVRNTAPGPDGTGGWGIGAEDGATLTATGCTAEGNADAGVYASAEGTTVELVDTVVHDTAPRPDGTGGWGIGVQEGAALTATGCTVDRNNDAGIFATDDGTTVVLVETGVRGTAPRPDGSAGWGIEVYDGATLTATSCMVEGNTEAGVFAYDDGTTVGLVDTQVLDTAASPAGSGGVGIGVQDGATLDATGCTVERNSDLGVYAAGDGTLVHLVDTVVRNSVPSPDGTGGRGIAVQDGATLSATDCTVEGNSDVGVLAGHDRTKVELVATVVRDTAPSRDGSGGAGIGVQDGATATATRCVVASNTGVGVFAAGSGTTVGLVDTLVRDTAPSPNGAFGRGIGVQEGATLTATDCTVEGNTEVGVFASDEGTTVEFVATVVQDTRRSVETGFAMGAGVQDGAVLSVDSCTLSGTEGPGLYATRGARVSLNSTTLTTNTFAGAMVLNATATLDHVTITDTIPDAQWGGGFGVYATGHFGPPILTLTHSTIGPHPYAAVWLDGDGTYLLEDNDLSGDVPHDLRGRPIHGNAVFAERGVRAWDGTSGLALVGNRLHDATDVAVLLDESSAWLDDNTFDANGTDVWQQRCDDVAALVSPEPDWVVCDGGTLLTDSAIQFTTLYLPEVDPE